MIKGFLSNYEAENYQQLLQRLIEAFRAMRCRMSLKRRMLDTYLEKFKENMGAYSENQGERFHQDVKEIEHRYQSHCNKKIMGDNIWGQVPE